MSLRLALLLAVVLGGVVAPRRAGAQVEPLPAAAPLPPPPPRPEAPLPDAAPRLRLQQPALGSRRPEASPAVVDRGGWAAFGAQTGFFTSAFVATAVIVGSTRGLPDWAPLALVVGTVGATVVGGVGARGLAARFNWSREAGWGMAGVWPGALLGLSIAAASMFLIDPNPSADTRLAAAGVGVVSGAALGYLLFRELSRDRRYMGWTLAGFWGGFFAGEITALAIMSAAGSASRDPHVLFLGTATGAIGGLLVASLLTVRHD